MPHRARKSKRPRKRLTLEPNFVSTMQVLIDDELWRRVVKESRGRMDEEIFVNAKSPVGDSSSRSNFGV